MNDDKKVSVIDGGVTAPKGFKAGTAACAIKAPDRKDLVLIASDIPAVCAGMFTKNRVKGSPVLISREHVKNGKARAIIANSGNANVCNGEEGIESALAMVTGVSKLVGCAPSEVLVASTGVIGRSFPIDKVAAGIPAAYDNMSADYSPDVAAAIMTTDTVRKEIAVELEINGEMVKIGAIAKGSGMISPNMATMFCFITTDADIDAKALRKALQETVARTFNCLTVDGDMSTSDTVFILANGAAGNNTIRTRSKAFERFSAALTEVCLKMTRELARDGEGATRLIEINVRSAAGTDEARCVGLAIANSPLVKTAFFGCDPNWGRIICAAGYSGVAIEESRITIVINGVKLFDEGKVIPFNEKEVRRAIDTAEVKVDVDLGMGEAKSTIYTSDLTYEYVKINAEYTT